MFSLTPKGEEHFEELDEKLNSWPIERRIPRDVMDEWLLLREIRREDTLEVEDGLPKLTMRLPMRKYRHINRLVDKGYVEADDWLEALRAKHREV